MGFMMVRDHCYDTEKDGKERKLENFLVVRQKNHTSIKSVRKGDFIELGGYN